MCFFVIADYLNVMSTDANDDDSIDHSIPTPSSSLTSLPTIFPSTASTSSAFYHSSSSSSHRSSVDFSISSRQFQPFHPSSSAGFSMSFYGNNHSGPSSASQFEERKTNPLISDTEKCGVCGEAAAKHVHYGATTCFSCRAFFRRSIQNGSAKQYNCKKGGHCDITLKTRKNCQKCRLEKCFTAGMKASWVLTEEERFRRSVIAFWRF